MYDGDLTLNDIEQYLDDNDDYRTDSVPTTAQDTTPHKDGLFGREYNERFDQNQMGRQGTNVLNDPVNEQRQPDGDHFDVIEQDPTTGNIYHNRINDPGL